MKPYFLEVLLSTLFIEKDVQAVRQILHLLISFVYDDAQFSPGLPALIIKNIQEMIGSGAWSEEVVLLAFDALGELSQLSDYVQRNSKSCVRELLLNVCKYIESFFLDDTLVVCSLFYERS